MELINTPLIQLKNKNYQAKSNSNPILLVLYLCLTCSITLFMGYIYTSIIQFIPFVYLNVIITFIFGSFMGYINYYLAHLLVIKTDRERMFVYFISAIIGYYAAWINYCTSYIIGDYPELNEFLNHLYLFYRPDIILSQVSFLIDYGPWGLFGFPVSGIALVIVWCFEALLIFFLVYKVSREFVAQPYSELERKWYPEYELLNNFSHVSAAQLFFKEIESNFENAFDNLGKGFGTRHSTFSVFYLKQESKQYLSVNNKTLNERAKGLASSPVFRYYEISSSQSQWLFDKYGKSRKRVFSFKGLSG